MKVMEETNASVSLSENSAGRNVEGMTAVNMCKDMRKKLQTLAQEQTKAHRMVEEQKTQFIALVNANKEECFEVSCL